MKLRRAHDSDSIDLLMWKNDPHSLAMSGCAAPVEPMAHGVWFRKLLDDPDRFMFIGVVGTTSVGMVRFDKTGDAFKVSVNVAQAERGKGYGDQLVKSGILKLGDYVGRVPLLAKIKGDNLASIRIFERCGFELIANEDGWLHYRRH